MRVDLPSALSDGSMSFDAKAWPVLVVTIHNRTTNVIFQEYLRLLRRLLEMRESQVHVLDIAVGASMPRDQMQMQSRFLDEHREIVHTSLRGTALVFHSVIHRFGMAAMLALMPRAQQTMAYEVFGDRGEAVSWGRTLLSRSASAQR